MCRLRFIPLRALVLLVAVASLASAAMVDTIVDYRPGARPRPKEHEWRC
jgi:hypothetical protein